MSGFLASLPVIAFKAPSIKTNRAGREQVGVTERGKQERVATAVG
jgi:hypothetical protein